ncbi:Pcc1-domain-containing protein [Cystobasidium minutum MCA 4210]|uniref:Pcc1-domain-containing protein n=1 Tax=Cystobasidium minutum MCA 4210 TaxID=1397322 RepID=UPI0034CE9881|eukprot:jgi/Rhomi1/197746/gm1.5960_g
MSDQISTQDRSDWHTVTVSIPFENERQAATALRVISVDKILRSDTVSRELRVEGDNLVATYQAVSARQVRVALDHFFSDVQLVTDTMNEFDPEKVKVRREQAAQTAVEAQGNQVEVGAT